MKNKDVKEEFLRTLSRLDLYENRFSSLNLEALEKALQVNSSNFGISNEMYLSIESFDAILSSITVDDKHLKLPKKGKNKKKFNGPPR